MVLVESVIEACLTGFGDKSSDPSFLTRRVGRTYRLPRFG
jgi:hypothetical protein